jgi:hypothetical protein
MDGKYTSQFPRYRTLQLLTAHEAPPYYPARGGDIALERSGRAERIDETVVFDLTHLHRVSDVRGDFAEFLRERSNAA